MDLISKCVGEEFIYKLIDEAPSFFVLGFLRSQANSVKGPGASKRERMKAEQVHHDSCEHP